MLKINLATVKQVLTDYELPKSEMNAFAKVIRQQILDNVQYNLYQLANTKLKSSRNAYIEGIVRKDNTIEIKGALPNAVESGCPPFDMKDGFARSSKVKHTKTGGWYLTIPFRIGTPNSSGINFPAMPRDIYQAIRAGKKPDTSNYPPGTRETVRDPASGKVWEAYAHKTSIFEGIKQTSNNPQRNTYGTFRRVGSNSDPSSWIHPGIQAHNLLDQAWAQTDVSGIIDNGLDLLI